VSLFFKEYQHLLIDHLGYLALLKKNEPITTRFILVDTTIPPHDGHTDTEMSVQQKLLKTLDPEFYERIEWLHCLPSSGAGSGIMGWTQMAQIQV
jgi:hypothetical protein